MTQAGTRPCARRLRLLVAAHALALGGVTVIAATIVSREQWRPVELLVVLGTLIVTSEFLSRRFEVRGTINISGSDVYLFSTIVLLGPVPALVVLVGAELGLSVLYDRPRRPPLTIMNNVTAYSVYALVGGLAIDLVDARGMTDPVFLVVVGAALIVANLLCFLIVALFWQVGFGEPVREALPAYFRFAPAHAIAALLTAVGIVTYARAGFATYVVLLVTFVASEFLTGRLSTVEVALRRERDRAQRYLDIAGTIILALDRDGKIELVNKRGCDVIGYPEAELLGRRWTDFVRCSDGRAEFTRLLADEVETSRFESTLRTSAGDDHIVAWEARVLYQDGKVGTVLVSGEDITERRRAEREVAFLAFHDRLTRLPNRATLDERLEAMLADAREHRHTIALLYLDFDNFKRVNDTVGHAGGDELLVEVAARLRRVTRDGDLAVRHGGDEFLVLTRFDAPEDEARAIAAELADRVRRVLSDPFVVGGAEIRSGASVGIAIYPGDADDAESLLRRADEAMYAAKQARRAEFRLRRVA